MPDEPKTAAKPHRAPRVTYSRAVALGYDAAGDAGKRRKTTSTTLKSEDSTLGQTDRKRLINRARDLRRNFTVARWMVRKHLDWVTSFAFQSHTDDPEWDTAVEEFVAEWAKPWNSDLNRRHSFWQMLRGAEACRVVDGDLLFSRLSDGRLQPIEGDRIQTPFGHSPKGYEKETFVNGVQVSKTGAALGYAVCDRDEYGGFVFRTVLPAAFCTLHAHFDRFDQVRGVSELASAMNDLQDNYEAKVYALGKMKAAQLCGLVTKRGSDSALGTVTGSGDSANEIPFSVDMGKGLFHLDLEPEDTAEIIEARTPSEEFQNFWRQVTMMTLKALNLPYSFWDESFTNFFGSRSALINYVQSATHNRGHVATTATALLRWRLGIAVANGELTLPAGLAFNDAMKFQLQPKALPWWNPLQEVKADLEAVHGRLISRRRLLAERGIDFFEVVDELDEEEAYIATKANLKPPAPATPPPPPVADGYGPQEDADAIAK